MRRIMFLVLGALALGGWTSYAQGVAPTASSPTRIGAGLIIGEPLGLSVKAWLNDTHAIDGGMAWSYYENDSLQLHSDFLWHQYEWLTPSGVRGTLPVYYGVGGRLKFAADGPGNRRNDGNTIFGIRVPVGIDFLPYSGPYDIFVELVPVFDVSPSGALTFNGGVGFRYYFP